MSRQVGKNAQRAVALLRAGQVKEQEFGTSAL